MYSHRGNDAKESQNEDCNQHPSKPFSPSHTFCRTRDAEPARYPRDTVPLWRTPSCFQLFHRHGAGSLACCVVDVELIQLSRVTRHGSGMHWSHRHNGLCFLVLIHGYWRVRITGAMSDKEAELPPAAEGFGSFMYNARAVRGAVLDCELA
jgi:hypothetical protein